MINLTVSLPIGNEARAAYANGIIIRKSSSPRGKQEILPAKEEKKKRESSPFGNREPPLPAQNAVLVAQHDAKYRFVDQSRWPDCPAIKTATRQLARAPRAISHGKKSRGKADSFREENRRPGRKVTRAACRIPCPASAMVSTRLRPLLVLRSFANPRALGTRLAVTSRRDPLYSAPLAPLFTPR